MTFDPPCITLWSGVLATKFGGREYLRNLTCGRPQMTPAWPLTPAMSYNLISRSSYQIWWPCDILSNLTSGWPLHDLWPQQRIRLWSGILPTKFGGHRALLSKLAPTWPNLTVHDLRPQQCVTLWSGVLPTKFGGHRALLSKLTPTWPQLTPIDLWPH